MQSGCNSIQVSERPEAYKISDTPPHPPLFWEAGRTDKSLPQKLGNFLGSHPIRLVYALRIHFEEREKPDTFLYGRHVESSATLRRAQSRRFNPY